MSVSIEYTAESKATLARFERISPKILRRAYGRAASAAKRSLFSAMKHGGRSKTLGLECVAKRQAITRRLHGGTPSAIFGKFATDTRYHVAYLRGDTQVIGWADRLHGFLSAIQSAENRDLSAGEKKAMYAILASKGVKNPSIPASYSRPERAIIDTFAEKLVEVYPSWIINNFEKMFAANVSRRAS